MRQIKPVTLEALRKALEAKTITKQVVGAALQTVTLPDPAYALLLALARGNCPYGGQHSKHVSCYGTGYLTRTAYWQAAPDGALEGSFQKALWPIIRTSVQTALEREAVEDLLARLESLGSRQGDTRQNAVELVLEWLTGV